MQNQVDYPSMELGLTYGWCRISGRSQIGSCSCCSKIKIWYNHHKPSGMEQAHLIWASIPRPRILFNSMVYFEDWWWLECFKNCSQFFPLSGIPCCGCCFVFNNQNIKLALVPLIAVRLSAGEGFNSAAKVTATNASCKTGISILNWLHIVQIYLQSNIWHS